MTYPLARVHVRDGEVTEVLIFRVSMGFSRHHSLDVLVLRTPRLDEELSRCRAISPSRSRHRFHARCRLFDYSCYGLCKTLRHRGPPQDGGHRFGSPTWTTGFTYGDILHRVHRTKCPKCLISSTEDLPGCKLDGAVLTITSPALAITMFFVLSVNIRSSEWKIRCR